jgi:hypothetical protein
MNSSKPNEEFCYAFPTTIPSVLAQEVPMNSIDTEEMGYRLSMLIPMEGCCSYCLKLTQQLYKTPFLCKFSSEEMFCQFCMDNVLKRVTVADAFSA